MSLSNKEILVPQCNGKTNLMIKKVPVYNEKDIKEFIEELRNKFDDLKAGGYSARDIWYEINKLAGDKLIEGGTPWD